MLLVDPFLDMQLRGVLVDQDRRAKLTVDLRAQQQEAIRRLEPFTGGDSIMGPKAISPKRLAWLLYDKLKLPRQFDRKTGKVTTSKRALEKLASKVNDTQRAAFNDVTEIRHLGEVISNFLEAELDSDGRLRFTANIAGTETGRTSSSSSPWWTGTGVQNWPDEAREIVIADPGYVFIYPDGEQAEARVVAWLAQDAEMMRVFDSGEDVHCMMASYIFEEPYEKILAGYLANDKKYVELRYIAKRTVHANNYGMGKRKFATIIRKSEAVAEALQNRYFAIFPSIKSRFQG